MLRVLPTRYGEILASYLIQEYAAECCIPDAEPQPHIYAAMEQAGALECFGAYIDDALVGFVSVVSSIMPHNGKRIATIESIYAAPEHRDSGAGTALMDAAEEFSATSGCIVLIYTARVGSALEKVLSRRSGCSRSHAMFSRWL